MSEANPSIDILRFCGSLLNDEVTYEHRRWLKGRQSDRESNFWLFSIGVGVGVGIGIGNKLAKLDTDPEI